MSEPLTPQRVLLHVLNDIEDVGGIHDRFMPDLVSDIILRLAAHDPPFRLSGNDELRCRGVCEYDDDPHYHRAARLSGDDESKGTNQ